MLITSKPNFILKDKSGDVIIDDKIQDSMLCMVCRAIPNIFRLFPVKSRIQIGD